MTTLADLNLFGSVAGLPAGVEQISLPVVVSGAIGQFAYQTLATGNNTVTVPTGAKVFILVPPSGATATMTAKGISGDTGISISSTLPTMLTFGTTPATLVITVAAGPVTVQTIFL